MLRQDMVQLAPPSLYSKKYGGLRSEPATPKSLLKEKMLVWCNQFDFDCIGDWAQALGPGLPRSVASIRGVCCGSGKGARDNTTPRGFWAPTSDCMFTFHATRISC